MVNNEEKTPKKIHSASLNVELPMPQASMIATVRTNLSVMHLIAAARFSRCVSKIESECLKNRKDSPYSDVFPYCSAAVLQNVASLEAYINEVLTDREKHFSSSNRALLERLDEYVDRLPIIEKYGFTLFVKGKQEFSSDQNPAQNVSVLIRLRNALVHFRPEWDDKQKEHAKLSKVLRGKFEPNPFFQRTDPLFPKAWATHGCTAWAVNSCLALMKEFEKRMELPPKFDKHADKLKP